MSSVYDTIVSAIIKEYPELESLTRNQFSDVIFDRKDTQFWLKQKRFFIGSTTTFENLRIDDSNNYPFRSSTGDNEYTSGGMMASYQQLGAAGEIKCSELLYTCGDNKLLSEFFDMDNTIYRLNETKLLWHDGRRQKMIEPWSFEDYYILFSATPDIIGLNKKTNELASDEFPDSKIDLIKNLDLLNNVVEIKSSLIGDFDEMANCAVRKTLLSTTKMEEQTMFYQLTKYKSADPVVHAVEECARKTIAYYYKDTILLKLDNHVNLAITNPRVHNTVYTQAVKKIADGNYDSKYVVKCQSSEFRCEFDMQKDDAVKFVANAKKKFIHNKGLKKIVFYDARYSSTVRRYIFNNKSNMCKSIFQQTKIKKPSNDIYDKIEDALRENVKVLLIPSSDLTQARMETDIDDVRLNPRSGCINQLLREMVAGSNLVACTRTDMTGYLLLPSFTSYQPKSSKMVEYNLHSLLAFKFVVPVDLLHKFRDEVVCHMIHRTRDVEGGNSLKLSTSALSKIISYEKQFKKPGNVVRSRHTLYGRKRKIATGVQFEQTSEESTVTDHWSHF